jgi:hypothetical protein
MKWTYINFVPLQSIVLFEFLIDTCSSAVPDTLTSEKALKLVVVPRAFHRPGYKGVIKEHLFRLAYNRNVVLFPTLSALPDLATFEA